MCARQYTLSVAAVLVLSPVWAAAGQAKTQTMSLQTLQDKIKGGWAGQMIGVSYGAPTEFHVMGKINEEPLAWSPNRVENAIHQDDLYVEMTFAKVMDTAGLNATSAQYGEMFRDSKYGLWHANAGARRVLNQGIQAPSPAIRDTTSTPMTSTSRSRRTSSD